MRKLGLLLTASVLSLQASEGWGFAGMKPGELLWAFSEDAPKTPQEEAVWEGAFYQATKDGDRFLNAQQVTAGVRVADQTIARLRAALGVGGGGGGAGVGGVGAGSGGAGAGHTPDPYAELEGVPGMFERADAEYAKAEAGRVLGPVLAAMQEEQNRYAFSQLPGMADEDRIDYTGVANTPAIHARTVLAGVGPEQLLDILASARLKAEDVPDSPELAAVLHAAHNHLQDRVDNTLAPLLERIENLAYWRQQGAGDSAPRSFSNAAEHIVKGINSHKLDEILAALQLQGQLREHTPTEKALLDIAAAKQLSNAYNAYVQPLVEVMQAEENRYIFSELPGMADEDRIDYTDVVNSPADHARNILANKTAEARAALHNTLVTVRSRGYKLTDIQQALLDAAAERRQDEIVKRKLFDRARGTMHDLLAKLDLARNFATPQEANFNEAQTAKTLVEASSVAELATLLDANKRGAFGTVEPHVQTLLNVAQQRVNAHATLAPHLVAMNEFADLAQQGGALSTLQKSMPTML